MKAFLAQVMIKYNVALIYVMRALQREAYTAPLAVCPPPKKTTELINFLQDRQGGGQNAKELSVSAPLISTHDDYTTTFIARSDRSSIYPQTTAAALAHHYKYVLLTS